MRSRGPNNVIGPVTGPCFAGRSNTFAVQTSIGFTDLILFTPLLLQTLQSSACLMEAGELIAARLKTEDMIELGELVDDQLNPRAAVIKEALKGDVTIWKSVGLAPQDSMIATLVVEKAEELGIGTIVEDYDLPN